MTGSEARMTSHYFTLAQKSLQGQKIVRGRHNLIPRALPTHEISVENVATTAGGYGFARAWDTRRRARIWEACARMV